MFNSETAIQKWQALLDHKEVEPIKDPYKRAVTAVLLENQQRALREQRGENTFLTEADNTVGGYDPRGGNGSFDKYDPVLISLVRRAMPNLIAYDIAGVQPMTQPSGLIFALRSLYKTKSVSGTEPGDEALFDEADTAFSGSQVGTNPGGMSVSDGENLSGKRPDSDVTDPEANTGFGQMGFDIQKTNVVARTRALRATYTMELAQDLKSVHGLDAESELSNILSTEILAEINREIINGINRVAKNGGPNSQVDNNFDLVADTDGRWSVEKYKAMIYQIEREANEIAIDSRRGRGNWIIASSNVASALVAAGMLDYTPALSTDLQVDPTGNTYAGTLNGRMKVYIDPYAYTDYMTVGYRGSNPYDAGVFYCPYVPLTMVRAVGENDFQPRIGFKTRYGIRANPFVDNNESVGENQDPFGPTKTNFYFRHVRVSNLLSGATS